MGSGSGNNIETYEGIDVNACADHCNLEVTCAAFTYFHDNRCKLKSALGSQNEADDRDTYVKLSGI